MPGTARCGSTWADTTTGSGRHGGNRPAAPVAPAAVPGKPRKEAERPRKLTFKEERELEALPERIGKLEEEQGALHRTLSDPEFYRTAGGEVAKLNGRLAELEKELEEAYRRWEELEAVRG